jgi:acyl-CoA synthetase (AMP-forming)/AMP-acid ligase II
MDTDTTSDTQAGDNPLPPLSQFEQSWKTLAFLPDPSLTFPSVFARRFAADPASVAFSDVSVDRADVTSVEHTRADVDADVRAAAHELSRIGVAAGDRVLLCVSETRPFFAFLLGAQALGAVPVPLPSPGEFRARSAFRERIEAVAADCAPRAVIVDSLEEAESLAGVAEGAAVVPAGALAAPDRDATPPPGFRFDRSFHETAFIQYTSGSTGSPKGVVVTHYNLVANLRAIAEAGGFGPNDRSFNWLPLYHDMGLVGGFLVGLYLGLPTFVMPTRTFVGRPDSWLRAMSRFQATFACAPNFAFNMLARRLPDSAFAGLDLSHWRLACNGAEPIDRSTVEDFMRRFAPVGLSAGTMFPVYGMAECTLAAALPEPRALPRFDCIDRGALSRDRAATTVPGGGPGGMTFVSVGRAMPGHRIRIVDPGGTDELGERQIGEVTISGPSISPYYFRKAGDYPAPRTELRTGDLGYVADGELYIVDRVKDLLIIGGKNIVPSDVERIVARVKGVRYGSVVAFAIRGQAGTDELYLVLGVDPQADREPIRKAARAAVLEHFGVWPREVALVKPSAIPKTSSGKIRRAACRDLLQQRAFATVPPPAG